MSAPTRRASTKRSPKAAAKPSPPAGDPLEAAAAPAVPSPAAGDDDSPVLGLTSVAIDTKTVREDEPPPQMVTIFEIDGRAYRIPREPTAALVIKYLFDLRQRGRDAAVETMAVTFIGEHNFQALAQAKGVGKEQVIDILSNVGIVFFQSNTYDEIIGAAGN